MRVHRFLDGGQAPTLGKVVCVGRNYAEHAKELGHAVPERPLLFMKPATSVVPLEEPIHWPVEEGICHHETELSVLIGTTLCRAHAEEARHAIIGWGIGLDLTLRDLQDKLKKAGHPWERAKAFDGAAPMSPFLRTDQWPKDWQDVHFGLLIDGVERQRGHTADMLMPILALLVHISHTFTLCPGDVVMTGTPAGVGPLVSGQQLTLTLHDRVFTSSVA